MGGHYGSVQFRCDDRDRVLAAAEAVARDRGIRCLVGPTHNGWTGVYPEGHGQDDAVGRQLAARVGGHALHLLVHDDDVLAYWLWLDGELVDRYWSAPGYFGEENRAAEEPLVADPERFAFVLDETGRAKLRKLLKRGDGPTFEHERLTEFGKALGIRNAVTAYEYLCGGETYGVTGWPRRFSTVPAGAVRAERARRAEERTRIKVERARLQSVGLLLAFEERPELLLTACVSADGFIVLWHDLLGRNRSVQHHRPPWKLPAATSKLAPADAVYLGEPASDRTGQTVAVAADGVIRFWQWSGAEWHNVAERPDSRGVSDVSLSPDGRRVAYKREEPRELVVTQVVDSEAVRMSRLTMDRQIAFSPDGRWIVLAAATLGIFRTSDSATARTTTERIFGVSRGPLIAASKEQRGPETCFCVGFDDAARWLWVGTEVGLRVYEWSALTTPKDGEQLIAVRTFDLPASRRADGRVSTTGYVYAGVSEPNGTGVVFGGLTGELFRMDLANGEVRRLMALLEGGTICRLAISPDGTTLGVCSSVRDRHGMTVRSTWEIWDYNRLLAEA